MIISTSVDAGDDTVKTSGDTPTVGSSMVTAIAMIPMMIMNIMDEKEYDVCMVNV